MTNSQSKALSNYRRRLRREGIVRLEVKVRREDAALVRNVASALVDPEREDEVRALLKERFGLASKTGLKALIAAAPLENVDLSREHDFGRDIAL